MTEHYIIAPMVMFAIIVPLSLMLSYAIGSLPQAKYIIGISR